jgi:hypothetical protein
MDGFPIDQGGLMREVYTTIHKTIDGNKLCFESLASITMNFFGMSVRG